MRRLATALLSLLLAANCFAQAVEPAFAGHDAAWWRLQI
jgi:hypothetical protein